VLYASVIEFIHTATLVHDDIIDESRAAPWPRRGAHAVGQSHHRSCSATSSISSRCPLALTQDNLEIIRLLCDVTLRIVEGEIYQLTKNGSVDLSERGALRHRPAQDRVTCLPAAPRIGGDAGSTTREQQEALWDYGSTSAWRSRSSTTCSTSRRGSGRSASQSVATSAEGKMTLPGDPSVARRAMPRQRAAPQGRRGAGRRALEDWRDIRIAAVAVAID
jgi:hypothetical protein